MDVHPPQKDAAALERRLHTPQSVNFSKKIVPWEGASDKKTFVLTRKQRQTIYSKERLAILRKRLHTPQSGHFTPKAERRGSKAE